MSIPGLVLLLLFTVAWSGLTLLFDLSIRELLDESAAERFVEWLRERLAVGQPS
jgi:hypothetical protein